MSFGVTDGQDTRYAATSPQWGKQLYNSRYTVKTGTKWVLAWWLQEFLSQIAVNLSILVH